MNKKEISEIRKQFLPENCSITRICGCYVDSGKNKLATMKEAFMSLPEEEMFKYLDIFKKTLSGNIGRNFLNLEYSIADEITESPHAFLMGLRESQLNDDMILDEFYNRVIENYETKDPYYIVLIHGVYDIPGKASDNTEMFDVSENVYEFILCSICLAKLAKPSLSYDATENRVENRVRDWIVDAPHHGFLFPAFNDRNTDIHSCLYYTKRPDNLQDGFMKEVIGITSDATMTRQNEAFRKIIEATLGEEGSVEEVFSVYEKLNQIVEDAEYALEIPELDKQGVKNILIEAIGENECMCRFDSIWNQVLSENEVLLATNIAENKKMSIECGYAEIKIAAEYARYISERKIDGMQCLVTPSNGNLVINGATIRGRKDGVCHE